MYEDSRADLPRLLGATDLVTRRTVHPNLQDLPPKQGPPTQTDWPAQPAPEGHWERVSVDFIVELPDAHGFDAVMVVVDSVTKRPHFMATNTMVSAEGAAHLYYRDMWKLHGLPLQWLHNRSSVFIVARYLVCGQAFLNLSKDSLFWPSYECGTHCVDLEG